MNALHMYPDISTLLFDLQQRIDAELGVNFLGFYLYGSTVSGDFDYDISDLDLVAVTASLVGQQEFLRLTLMHQEFAKDYPKWSNRIEVQYQSLHGLKTFRSRPSPMVVISPGDPLHYVDAGKDWLTNWYLARNGVVISGPSADYLIPEISEKEFISAIKHHAEKWREHVTTTRNSQPYQGFAVMTMCRALYTTTKGEQVSKKAAAAWVKKRFPQWQGLIDLSFEWRANFRGEQKYPEMTYHVVERFVSFMADQIASA